MNKIMVLITNSFLLLTTLGMFFNYNDIEYAIFALIWKFYYEWKVYVEKNK